MGDLSKHFNRSEFACNCGCGYDAVKPRLIQALEDLRTLCGNRAITITSGCRCIHHNSVVGGEKNSKHLLGEAADIKVKGMKPLEVFIKASDVIYFKQGGRGVYDTWTHLDVGTGNNRPGIWDKRKRNK